MGLSGIGLVGTGALGLRIEHNMKLHAQKVIRKPTARRAVAATLTEEILDSPDPKDFLIASEHQLCRRFAVSRVTIRLALSDLENRGLIYRRHGKGTFAHGCSTRVHRSIGILLKSPDDLKCSTLIEFVRGAQTAATSLGSSILLIGTSPLSWRAEVTNTMGSVILTNDELTEDELRALENRNLPFIFMPNSELTRSDNDCFDRGYCTANALFRAAITGGQLNS